MRAWTNTSEEAPACGDLPASPMALPTPTPTPTPAPAGGAGS